MPFDPVSAPIRLTEHGIREHEATAATASGATRASDYQWRVCRFHDLPALHSLLMACLATLTTSY